jgi:glyoxylase-like metal-dependent hydrolase (beta-lactamase superfamily II)
MDGDRVIAPGVTALATPGHTPGHHSVVVSAGSERAFILGDAVTCPAQLEETEWQALSDVDGPLAARGRRSFGSSRVAVAWATGCHFPGLEFGRVIKGAGAGPGAGSRGARVSDSKPSAEGREMEAS